MHINAQGLAHSKCLGNVSNGSFWSMENGWEGGIGLLLLELPSLLLLFSKPILSTHPSGNPTSLCSSSELLTLLGWDCGITDMNSLGAALKE